MLRLSEGLQNAILGGPTGDSVQSLLAGGVMRIYSGTQPADANTAESGTLLAEITLDGGTFTPGASSTNGLTFDNPASGGMEKAAAETWQGVGVADGNGGWFRFYDSLRIVGDSTTSKRFDGAIASSGGELTMTSSQINVGTPVILNTFTVSLPAS